MATATPLQRNALRLFVEGNYPLAIKEFTKSIQKAPNNATLLWYVCHVMTACRFLIARNSVWAIPLLMSITVCALCSNRAACYYESEQYDECVKVGIFPLYTCSLF